MIGQFVVCLDYMLSQTTARHCTPPETFVTLNQTHLPYGPQKNLGKVANNGADSQEA